jgi:hypothetical protein
MMTMSMSAATGTPAAQMSIRVAAFALIGKPLDGCCQISRFLTDVLPKL